nr:M56 family metallopeptidase [uncultured Agathobaculum sp.]
MTGNELLLNLVQIGLTVSAAALVLFILRKVLKKRYPARAICFVWALLAIRLLIPVQLTLPDAPVQITPRTTYLTQTEFTPAALERAGLPVIEQDGAFTTERWVTSEQAQALTPNDMPTLISFDLGYALAFIWMLGLAAFSIWQLYSYMSFLYLARGTGQPAERDMLRAVLEEQKRALGIRRDIPLLVTPAADCPMLAGFIKPALYLPDEALSAQEAMFIFRHELTHYKRGDLWLKLLLTAARSVHWFNPLVHLLARFAQEDIELACDDAVVRGMDVDARRAYGETILRSAAAQAKRRALVSCFTGDKQTLMRRFEGIFDTRTKKRGAALIVAAALLVGTLGCAVSVGESEPSAVSETALEGNVYTNATYGYTLTLPDCFADRAYVNTGEDGSVTFGLPDALPGYSDDPTDGGAVMTLLAGATAELRDTFGEDWVQNYYIPCVELAERDGLTWFLAFASDVQYDPANPEITAAYTEMYQAAQAMDGSALSFEGQTGDQQENERALALRQLGRYYIARENGYIGQWDITADPAENACTIVGSAGDPPIQDMRRAVRVWFGESLDSAQPIRTQVLADAAAGVTTLDEFLLLYDTGLGLPACSEDRVRTLLADTSITALRDPVQAAEWTLGLSGGTADGLHSTDDGQETNFSYVFASGSRVSLAMKPVQLGGAAQPVYLPVRWDAGDAGGSGWAYDPYTYMMCKERNDFSGCATEALVYYLAQADGAYAEAIFAELDQRWQQDADAVEDAVAGTGVQTVWAQHKAANPDIFGARFSDSEIEAACQAVRDYAGAHGFSVENLHYDVSHDFSFSQDIMQSGVLQDNVQNDGLTIENVITVIGDAQFDDDAWREQAEGWSFTLYRGADGKWVLEDGAYGY